MAVTVAITCFNAEETIGSTIESALMEISAQDEILIADDCSTDKSAEIYSKFLSDPRVRAIKHDANKGVAGARNTLVENAKGEFLAFLDDDDLMLKGRLSLQTDRLLKAELDLKTNKILCYGDRITQHGDQQGYVKCMGHDGSALTGDVVADYFLLKEGGDHPSIGRVGTCTLFARTNVLKEVGSFDISFRRCEDIDLAVRVALAGGYIVGVGSPVIQQRITAGVGSEKSFMSEMKYYRLLVNKYKGYLRQKNSYFFAIFRNAKSISANHNKKFYSYLYLMLCCLLKPAFFFEKILRR